MDLKLKGKRWLSQKPHKWLESVFNDIDGFISRDKSECAANQAATIGDIVKTDCPDVIQDPLSNYLEEPGKFEAQIGSSKRSDIVETYFNSNLGIEEFSDLASGNCIVEADGDLPSGLEVRILEDSESIVSIAVEENDSKEERADKFSDNAVEENSTNEKRGKHEAQVGSSENNSSLETSFQSMLSIGGKPVEIDVNRFSVDPLNKNQQKFSDVPGGNCTGEANDYVSSGMEIDALKDNDSNGVPDEIIIAKEEELIDKKTYIVVEENYMKEDLTQKYSDSLVKADDMNDELLYRKFDIVEDYCAEESGWKEGLDQCFSESKAAGIELTSSSTSLFTEIYNILKLPHMDDSCPEENISSSPRHALGYASETDSLGIPVENKTVDIGLASSNAAALSTETSGVLNLPHEDISNCEENICSKPVNADRCSFETLPQSSVSHSRKDELGCSGELNTDNSIPDSPARPPSETDVSGICVENKAVDTGLASSNTSVSTESYSTLDLSRCQENTCPKHVPAGRCASDLPYSVSSSRASQTSSYDNNSAGSTVSSSILSMLSNGGSCKIDIEDPGMETIELRESNEKGKLDGSCVVVDSELLHAASFRALRHNRSYKKILQDAFASRKRLRKEYEQLAILYGDIDIETNPQPAIDLLSSAASSSIHSEKSFPGSSEPEWELL